MSRWTRRTAVLCSCVHLSPLQPADCPWVKRGFTRHMCKTSLSAPCTHAGSQPQGLLTPDIPPRAIAHCVPSSWSDSQHSQSEIARATQVPDSSY